MCCLNAPLSVIILLFWCEPYRDEEDKPTWTQILTLPLIILFLPIAVILDLIFFPFILINRCCVKHCYENTEENNSNDLYYSLV